MGLALRSTRPMGWVAVCAAIALVASHGVAGAQPDDYATSWIGYDTSVYLQARFAVGSALADLDNDGDLDLATSNWWAPSKVTVILNDGTGRFGPPAYYPTVDFQGCMDVVAADVTGDGFADLVATNTGPNGEGSTVSLLRNLGNGSFAAQVTYSVGTGSFVGPVGIVAADFNADGRIDVAVANYGYIGQGTTVAVLRNDGSGGFLPPSSITVDPGPYKLAAGDLNGDGRPDLAVACDQAKLCLLLNNGAGFSAPVSHDILPSVGTDTYASVALGDLDHDGDLDVICGSTGIIDPISSSAAIALLRNSGNGALAPSEAIEVPLGGSDLTFADLNGDGWLDILSAQGTNGGWMAGLNDGAGHFPTGSFTAYPSGELPFAIEAGDMDGDGDVDPVVVNRFSLEACVHRNPGNADFSPPATWPAAPAGGAMDAADIDGDGDLDLAVGYGFLASYGGGIRIVRNRGDGTFDEPVDYHTPQAAGDVKLRDLDGDGDVDLVWADGFPPYNWNTRMNVGGGAFGPEFDWYSNNCGNGEIETGDVDGDGDLDVLLSEPLACPGILNSGLRIFVYPNQGGGTFGPFNTVVLNASPFTFQCVDMNHDGTLDIVTSSVCVSLGHGDGTFGASTLFAADWGSTDVVVADFDLDDDPDVATCNMGYQGPFDSQSMAVLRGQGDGSLGAAEVYQGSLSPQLGGVSGITAGDSDGDGDVDIIVSNWGSNDVSYFRNRGDGRFAPQIRYGAGWNPLKPFFGDFDGDSRSDLAILVGEPPSFIPRSVTVLRGLRGGVTAVEDEVRSTRPIVTSVRPNPSHAESEIRFTLPHAMHVRLSVFDAAGRRVARLVDSVQPAGAHTVEWNGLDALGAHAVPGVYFACLEASDRVTSRKFVMLW